MESMNAIEGNIDFDIVPDKQFQDNFDRVMDYEIPERRKSSMIPVTLLVVGIILLFVSAGALTFIHVYA